MSKTVRLAAVRAEFPVMTDILYLDSAHQTPMANTVRSALDQFLEQSNRLAGPKSQWLARVDQVRARLGHLINASAGEIAFTKNTSEGLNIAANSVPLVPGDQVLMLRGDHPNNTYAWLNLKRKGVEVKFIDLPDSAVACAQTFERHIEPTTKVISLSHISFHAGQRHDLESIGRLCESKGIYFVLDAMQSVGVVPIDVKKLGVSVLAAGCHKGLLVPQGLGLLYVKQSLQELQPPFLAMSSLARPPQDYIARPDDMVPRDDAGRFEIGNYNLPDIMALDASLALLEAVGLDSIEQHVLDLGDHLMRGLEEFNIGLVGPRLRGARAHIYVLDLPVAPWVDYFTSNLVRVSPERGGVRISFGLFNTQEDVDRLLELIRQHKV
jgi:cysteine desulfurase/selenocysteine lyase